METLKANELRIGNSVIINGTVIHEIGYSLIADVYQINIGISNSYLKTLKPEPIPLTEEWLVKLGGKIGDNEIYNDSFYCFEFDNMAIFVSVIGVVVIARSKYDSKSVKLDIQFKHVHTFQNLVHALTGNELTIKS